MTLPPLVNQLSSSLASSSSFASLLHPFVNLPLVNRVHNLSLHRSAVIVPSSKVASVSPVSLHNLVLLSLESDTINDP